MPETSSDPVLKLIMTGEVGFLNMYGYFFMVVREFEFPYEKLLYIFIPSLRKTKSYGR